MQKTIRAIQLAGLIPLTVILVALWIVHAVSLFMQTGSQTAMTYITNIFTQSFPNEEQPERNGADGSNK